MVTKWWVCSLLTCSQQYDLIYFYPVSYCQTNKAGLLSCLQTLIIHIMTWKSSYRHSEIVWRGVGREIRGTHWHWNRRAEYPLTLQSTYTKAKMSVTLTPTWISAALTFYHRKQQMKFQIIKRWKTVGFFLRCKFRADKLLCWYVFTLNLTVCKVTWTCVLYFFKPSLDNYITKGETLTLLYVVDFWKMLWHRCTPNRKKKSKYAEVYTRVS